MAGDIVLGYDGSDGAKAALPQAVSLAKALGATLVVAFAHGANPVGGVTGDLERETAKLGDRLLDEAVEQAKQLEASVKVERELVNALPVEGLNALASQRGARMIVVGGNGRGPVVGALLGSVTYKLLNHATVPVLVVQPSG